MPASKHCRRSNSVDTQPVPLATQVLDALAEVEAIEAQHAARRWRRAVPRRVWRLIHRILWGLLYLALWGLRYIEPSLKDQ